MKENMLDVLMYIFENYIDDDHGDEPDESALTTELGAAGFHQGEINKAFAWLEDLSQLCEQDNFDDAQAITCSAASIRVYSEIEKHKISLDARGFITRLEFYRIINASVREVILDRAMALEADYIDLDQMKWVAMMVLYNQPGRETSYLWLENLLFELEQEVLH